jgi:DNA polymerase-3 subunit epsilon
MNLMILDVETGGVENRGLLWAFSTLIPGTSNEAAHINGISPELLASMCAVAEDLGTGLLEPFLDVLRQTPVAALVAHVAKFDQGFVEAFFEEPLSDNDGVAIPWVCTEQDITWPKMKDRRPCRHLAHLCLDHGIPVGTQHRALADVMMIVELLKQVDDLEDQVARALKPRAVFQGQQRFEDNELAKQHGFRWDASGEECGRAKSWWKVLPFDTPQAPTDERPFPIKLLKPL